MSTDLKDPRLAASGLGRREFLLGAGLAVGATAIGLPRRARHQPVSNPSPASTSRPIASPFEPGVTSEDTGALSLPPR